MKKGAVASSVAHDSHNVIAVGVADEDICRTVNLVIEKKGGVSAVYGENEMILPLPIAGIMSDEDSSIVAEKYIEIVNIVKSLGSTLLSPLMTLSFMTLIVIPKIRVSDKGVFDVEKFEFVNIFKKD